MAWAVYLQSELPRTLAEIEKLKKAVDDEREPYKSKYAGGDLLQNVANELQKCIESCPEAEEIHALTILRSKAICERGIFLLDTDLAEQGESLVLEGLRCAWPPDIPSNVLKQRAYNALGALNCARSQFESSQEQLEAAVSAYKAVKELEQQQPDKQQQQAEAVNEKKQQEGSTQPFIASISEEINQAASSSSSAYVVPRWPCGSPSDQATAAEAHYTTSLYFLAQLHGLAGNKDDSAMYCAATLNRQIQSGEYDLDNWVQNCLQLSAYFINLNAFALAEYCLAAVDALLEKHGIHLQAGAKKQQQQQPLEAGQAGKAPVAKSDGPCCSEQEEDAKTSAPSEADAAVGATSRDDQQQQQLQQLTLQDRKDDTSRAAAGHDKGQQQDQGNTTTTSSSSSRKEGPADQGGARLQLSADIAANVHLARAKLNLYRLVASLNTLQGQKLEMKYSDPTTLPETFRFDALPGLAPPSSLSTWGHAALVASYASALPLAQAALPAMKAAMEYYQLDGWVTEHVNILFEMSNLYRILASFEADPHRACVMHKTRARLLLPLDGALSYQHYPGMVRSISLELGNIYREVHEIKESEGWPPEKVAAAGRQATKHYQHFLATFKEEAGGALGRVSDLDLEDKYLSAAFSMGRVMHKSACSTEEEIASVVAALKHLRAVTDYVSRNKLESWKEEAGLANQLADLLEQKMAMLQALAARQARK